MTSLDVIQQFLASNYRLVYWPAIGDIKGPTEQGWTTKTYVLEDYQEGYRVGLMTGTEVEPGWHIHDVDLDWAPGAKIALAFLPPTGLVFGRPSKPVSHAMYLFPETHTTRRYEDVDGTCLAELRGTKSNGDIGMQTMVPPSIWSKDGKQEQLTLVKSEGPAKIQAQNVIQKLCLSAIGMILARNLGENGFGHEARLCWAGFLLRAGITVEDLVIMGEAMSVVCNNREVHDVRRTVESTAAAMAGGAGKKVKGGPSLAKLIGDKGKAVIARINEWLGKDSDFVRDKDGLILRDHQENIARALRLLDTALSYHSFSERLEVFTDGHKTMLDDAVMEGLWLRIDRELRFRPTFAFFERVVKNIARESTYHAVHQYLDGLVWDGIPRLDRWLVETGGAEDTPYTRAISAIVLIAAVKRVREPGCKYDEMVVLEGSQGVNKSSALRALCADETWFSDDLPLNVDAKQIIERTLGKWIIEASDLAGKRKAEVEHLKSMMSRQVDGPARLAYAHNPVERARQFIFVGTTNSAAYLTDQTGSRRYWPVGVRKMLVGDVIRLRDQLWAEAAHRERLGESIRLAEELWPAASVEQDRRHSHDAWEDLIRDLLLNTSPTTTGIRRVATKHIWEALGIEPAHRDRVGGVRIAEILHKFGFKTTVVRVAGETTVVRGYATDDEAKLTAHQEDDPEVDGTAQQTPEF